MGLTMFEIFSALSAACLGAFLIQNFVLIWNIRKKIDVILAYLNIKNISSRRYAVNFLKAMQEDD